MKIETHLSPNCSEATFVIVDWKNKRLIEAWQESNESIDADGIASFITQIWSQLNNSGSIEYTSNGNSFHPDLLEALKELKQEGVTMADVDSPEMKAMSEELLEAAKGYKDIIYKHCKSKVELLAEGYYGGKKNGTKIS
jgi:hypothetical protein